MNWRLAKRSSGNLPLDLGGELYWRRDGELHQWNPLTVGNFNTLFAPDITKRIGSLRAF